MGKFNIPPECEVYGKEIDRLLDEGKYGELATYIATVETYGLTHNTFEYAIVFYYLGTGYSELANHAIKNKSETSDVSCAQYRRKALYYFRKAISLIELTDDTKTLYHLIYTNYANSLDACGRVIEALRIYRKAISLSENFGMAVGNYGRALNFYANMVNDSGHHKELHCYAYQAIKKAISSNDPNMHTAAKRFFEGMINTYESSTESNLLAAPIVLEQYDLGESEEFSYRSWCLEKHLFLTPLNDVIECESAFAHDPLTITRYTENVNKDDLSSERRVNPPRWFAMLNQLKEEYIYARFLCYDGSEKIKDLHYADKEVKLSLSDYDYVNYSIRLEQLKSAFRLLFSIFDKVAFFVNDFWNMGYAERQADARHIFLSYKLPKTNIALNALYWSYSEFVKDFWPSEDASERDLYTLRNALEHKFVKIHEYLDDYKLEIADDNFYHIGEQVLIEQCVRLVELARECIMYLVYAIDIEESKREKSDKAVSLQIIDFDDKWKI